MSSSTLSNQTTNVQSQITSDTSNMFLGDNCDHWVITSPTSEMLDIQHHDATPYRGLSQQEKDSLEKELLRDFGLN